MRMDSNLENNKTKESELSWERRKAIKLCVGKLIKFVTSLQKKQFTS